MEKKKVYVETTVVSDATALPSRDVIQLGRQLITKEWWQTASERFDLYSSLVVARETRKGDPEAVARRVAALAGIPELDVTEREYALARKLIAGHAVPREYLDDALHIAVAATQKMDYLVSWNFKHITNGQTIPIIERICMESGYVCPRICTPQMLMEGEVE